LPGDRLVRWTRERLDIRVSAGREIAGAVEVGSNVAERRWLCVYPIDIETDLPSIDFSRLGAMISVDDEEIVSQPWGE